MYEARNIYVWGRQYICLRHAIYMYEARNISVWGTQYICLMHAIYMYETRNISVWGRQYICLRHAIYMYEAGNISVWGTQYICMRHAIYLYEARNISVWGTQYICLMHVIYMYETRNISVWGTQYICLMHETYMYETRNISSCMTYGNLRIFCPSKRPYEVFTFLTATPPFEKFKTQAVQFTQFTQCSRSRLALYYNSITTWILFIVFTYWPTLPKRDVSSLGRCSLLISPSQFILLSGIIHGTVQETLLTNVPVFQT